uniref:Uncharacterized protein n=1 Tax=Anguilla anguilla TaxID=7936 RepID=A0A0E9VTG2_ANGAN
MPPNRKSEAHISDIIATLQSLPIP